MEPEQLVELIDFKHITEVVTKEEALALLKARRPEAMARKEEMKKDGFPAYTTSAGWLGYPEDKIRALCKVRERAHHAVPRSSTRTLFNVCRPSAKTEDLEIWHLARWAHHLISGRFALRVAADGAIHRS